MEKVNYFCFQCNKQCKDKQHGLFVLILLIFMPFMALLFIAMKYVNIKSNQ